MLDQKQFYRLAEALGGIPILGTLPGTPTARAGLRYGDILLAIEGQRTTSIGVYVEMMRNRGEKVLATIFRNGIEHEVTLDFQAQRRQWDVASALEYLMRGRSEDAGGEGPAALN